MIKAAIVGYGNIGKATLEAVESSADFTLLGIISRSGDKISKNKELANVAVVDDVAKLTEKPDVVILCTPTRNIEEQALKYLSMGIHTVDSFDIHEKIGDLRSVLNQKAKENQCVSIISAGWDPGSDSIVRTLLEAAAPKGITYTNFGPGMSMGHSTAVKAMDGVVDALSVTIPTGEGVHRRMVYVEIEAGAQFETVAESIKKDSYFAKDETYVFEVNDVNQVKDVGHGVNMVRKGVSGKTHNQLFEFNMKINNPALTSQILVASARAAMRQQPGAYTMIEIPVIDLLEGDREQWIRKLV